MRKSIFLLSTLALFACKDGTGPTPGSDPVLTLSTHSLVLTVGSVAKVNANVVNSTAAPQFTSRNQAVAQVDATGNITAVGSGTTYVVSVLAGFPAARDSVAVTVQPAGTPTLTLSADSVNLAVAANTRVIATILNAATANALFVTRDNTVASVDATGLITGLKIGKTIVVATLSTDANVRDSVIVVVVPGAQPVPPPIQLPLLGTGAVTDRYTAEVAVDGTIAYTSTWGTRNGIRGNAIKIWNVAGNVPLLIDSLIVQGAGTLGDVQISSDGTLLVVAIEGSVDNGIAIYSRANPAKPTLITRFATTTTRQGVHTLKLSRISGRDYAFLAIDPSGINRAKLDIVDITAPAAPVEVFTGEMGDPFVHDVFIRDGVLFAALWHTGMTIFDVGGAGRGGSPSNPVRLGTVKTMNCDVCGVGSSSVHNIWWFNDPTTGAKKYAFIGEEGPASLFTLARGDVHVVDVSDFDNPREVAFYDVDPATSATGQVAGAHNFAMDEASGILYAAFYNGGVRALDVRGDLASCTAAQKSADGRCNLRLMGREVGVSVNTGAPKFVWGVALQGSMLYASDMPNGIHKIDVSALKR